MALDDYITLGSQRFPVIGTPRASAVSDFETGIKVGSATYDNREHAFFLVLDDFTGGFGERHLSIREKLGTYWYVDPDKPLETAYSGRVTLPLSQSYINIPNPPSSFSLDVSVGYPFAEQNDRYFFGLGSAIYYIDALGGTPVRSLNVSGNRSVTSILNTSSVPDGKPRMYAAFAGYSGTGDLNYYVRDITANPTNSNFWRQTTQAFVKESNPITAGVTGDLLSEDTVYNRQVGSKVLKYTAAEAASGKLTYVQVPVYSTKIFDAEEPVFFPQNEWFVMDAATIHAKDLFWWDHKVLGVLRPSAVKSGLPSTGSSIAFLVPQSGDGLIAYTIPRGKYITSIYYTGGSPTTGLRLLASAGGGTYEIELENIVEDSSSSATSGSGGGSGQLKSIGSVQTGSKVVVDDGILVDPTIIVPQFQSYHGWVAGGHVVYNQDYEYKIAEGSEPWNFQVEGDEQIIAAPETLRELRFIGVAAAPWGEMAVYLRGGNRLYLLDFFARKLYPIEIGSNRPLIAACMWQGAVVATDGWDVFEYNPQAATQRNIGLPRKWGIPPNLTNGTNPYQCVYLCPNDDELIAVMYDTEEPATALFRYNTTGWHQLGARMHGFVPSYAFKVTFPMAGSSPYAGDGQAILVPGTDSASSPTEYGYWQINLPDVTHQPTVGVDTFAPSGGRIYTGWIDGGFFDIDGTLLRMNCDAFFHNTSEKIMVEYRLDNDSTSEESATWTQMVDENGTKAVFSSARRELFFPNTNTAPAAGIKFRTVQFRITHIRGSTATSVPEMRALTLVYLKTPELRTQWSLRIDVNRMIETMNDEDSDDSSNPYQIDGADASLYTVWNKLRSLWINDHELLAFTAPSILGPSETLYVKLTDIPVTFDDFRSEVGGKGYIDIQFVEPVAPQEDV